MNFNQLQLECPWPAVFSVVWEAFFHLMASTTLSAIVQWHDFECRWKLSMRKNCKFLLICLAATAARTKRSRHFVITKVTLFGFFSSSNLRLEVFWALRLERIITAFGVEKVCIRNPIWWTETPLGLVCGCETLALNCSGIKSENFQNALKVMSFGRQKQPPLRLHLIDCASRFVLDIPSRSSYTKWLCYRTKLERLKSH